MGKVATTSWAASNSDESSERIKKWKRKKDLEEIRRNALVNKRIGLRNSANNTLNTHVPKTKLMKTLNQFAKKRKEIEDANQSQDTLINRPRIISDDVLQNPLRTEGFFRAAVKGKQLTRPDPAQEKLRNAVLQSDALQLMQSGSYIQRNKVEENHKKCEENEIDPQMKTEFKKLFYDSSESSSDEDSKLSEKIKSSPVLGGVKNSKRKVNLERLNANKGLNKVSVTKNHSFVTKDIAKEEKCRRRLFNEEDGSVNSEKVKNLNNNLYDSNDLIRFSPSRPSPENIIYFSKHVPEPDNKPKEKSNGHKIKPSDSQVIKYYVETCKMIADKELKNMFKSIIQDPLKTAKTVLKNTYSNAFKEYLNKQKNDKLEKGSHSVGRSTVSSNSEIMLEPDSAIARLLKKNAELPMKNVTWTKSSSGSSVTNLHSTEVDFVRAEDFMENNVTKQKHALSLKSENSDREIPSSTKANVDPKSAKVKQKIDQIHPDRQELIARYLKDVSTNNKHEKEKSIFREQQKDMNRSQYTKEKLFISDSMKETYLVHKSSRHIPAILRKNRSLVDCVEKEKILLNINKGLSKSLSKCLRPSEAIKIKLSQDFNIDDNLESERTPNCENTVSTQLMEVPKSKYVHMNAKYNHPSRINIPSMSNSNELQRQIPERHFFPSPDNELDFLLPRNFKISPINSQLNRSSVENKRDCFKCSQPEKNSEQDNNCLMRMPSFGDIQERTDRLTLRSSQGQNYSQDSIDHICSSNKEHLIPHDHVYYQNSQPSSSYVHHNNLSCVPSFNQVPNSQSLDVALSSNYSYPVHNESPVYIPQTNFQVLPPENCPFQRPKQDFCLPNDYPMYRQPNPQHHQEPLMNCLQQQQQNPSELQPMKFFAVDGSRAPQRRAIYGPTDGSSFSHIHKTTDTNKHYNQLQQMQQMQTYNTTKEMPSEAYYTASSIPYQIQGIPQPVSSTFECGSIHKLNIIPSNRQSSSNFNNEAPRMTRKLVNFVMTNGFDQSFVNQPSMSMNGIVNNQRYIGQQLPSSLYSSVEHQQNHCGSIEGYKLSDVYSHQMNHNNHSKR